MSSSNSRPADLLLPAHNKTTSLRYQQGATVALLFAGYAAYYFCRSNFSVAMPLLIDHLQRQGMSNHDAVIHLGTIASLGVLAYAAGKLLLTGLGDIWGGRRSFTIGLGGAIIFTFVFASGGSVPLFTAAWIGNRLVQSIGWAGLVKVCSKWFSYSSYGMVAGILSLSYLVGDALARQSMGMLLHQGYGWRAVFYFAAAVAAIVFAADVIFLRESRIELGYTPPRANPLNLFAGSKPGPKNFGEVLKTLLLSRAFGIVCLLSLGCTIVRETFNIWTPMYLRDFFGYTESSAASTSAIFPAVGAISVLITGWLSDRLGANGRSLVMFFGLSATAVALLALMFLRAEATASKWPLLLIGAVAFCLLGPYSYLGGAYALDFGGSQGGAASSGLIDGVGYLGGIVAGDSVARLSVAFGWRGVFATLAAITMVSALAASYLYIHQTGLQRKAASARA